MATRTTVVSVNLLEKPKHYRVRVFPTLRVGFARWSDYPLWSGQWDVILTLAGWGLVEVVKWMVG